MRKLKPQLKQLISEETTTQMFAPTAAEEAAKVNRDLGDTPGAPGSLSEDPTYWEKLGITSGEDLAIDLVAGTYSDMYKAVHGIRPRQGFKSYEEVRIALEDLENYYSDLVERDELEAQAAAEYERERKELAALMPGEFDFEELPKQSGMGKRMENRVRLTVDDLESIINEALDGLPYDGPIEALAAIHANKWGHGDVVDIQGWKDDCKLGGQFTVGKAPSILSPKKLRMTENQLRIMIRGIIDHI